ncbi:putative PDDEXK endonuclease [Deinococcus aquatilis]|uniref:putative PDDEXK endonuclease n=1 Tax=Deinococcus aquatilis TaxID=519440 RepID=UPI00036216D3|nr:hypothetical protein [Deinococcus aquatilis]
MSIKKKAVNGNRKGKEGERELARALTELGYPASRGVQYKGGKDSPDVACPSLNAFHIECKLSAACQMFSAKQLAKWDAQAKADAGQQKIPLVVHRWNFARNWWVRVLMPNRSPYWQTLEDFLTELDRAKWGNG